MIKVQRLSSRAMGALIKEIEERLGAESELRDERDKAQSYLAMANVQKIVEEHGGTISLISSLEEGTEVQFVLPVAMNTSL